MHGTIRPELELISATLRSDQRREHPAASGRSIKPHHRRPLTHRNGVNGNDIPIPADDAAWRAAC
jgi:hypothetical protein